MDPITVLALASAAMKLVKEAIPAIRDAFANGEISEADQAKVRAEYDSLRAQAGGEFTGPEWELSGR
jgi:outer membrane protein TolC